ncbi:MAG: hypothetical protein JW715_04115 [Sedimentisphaerales bacterium]|nr:hypothetical protein [Sedimentisphaerales bacterium]
MKRLRRAHQRRINNPQDALRRSKKLRQKVIAAGTVAAITFGAAGLKKTFADAVPVNKPDQHQLVVSQDADADQLADVEEFAIGYRPFDSDQNRNQIPDGVELAKRIAAAVSELPSYIPGTLMPIPNRTYKIHHTFFGLERCDICGQQVNMGGYEIINPNLELSYPDPNDPLEGGFLPELALHYLEHGSFDCYGDVHQGRVDISRLMRVLELRLPYEPNEHQLAVTSADLDEDLLTDSEELSAGYNLYNPDQDEDLVPDGIELAKQCGEVIDSLPIHDPNGPEILHAIQKVSFLQRGLEYCDICGESVNMGYWKIENSRLGLSIDVSEIELHYMQHGSFSYAGDVHGKGRLDVPLLAEILEMPSRCGDLGTIFSPADTNRDCRKNLDDLTELLDQWLKNSDLYQSE